MTRRGCGRPPVSTASLAFAVPRILRSPGRAPLHPGPAQLGSLNIAIALLPATIASQSPALRKAGAYYRAPRSDVNNSRNNSPPSLCQPVRPNPISASVRSQTGPLRRSCPLNRLRHTRLRFCRRVPALHPSRTPSALSTPRPAARSLVGVSGRQLDSQPAASEACRHRQTSVAFK